MVQDDSLKRPGLLYLEMTEKKHDWNLQQMEKVNVELLFEKSSNNRTGGTTDTCRISI